MQRFKALRYYADLAKRKIRQMDRIKRQVIVISAGCLICGLIFGNLFGGMIQRRKSEKQLKQEVAEVRKEEQEKTKELEKELEKVHRKYSKEEKELPWNLTLVNSSHSMKKGYVPELTEVAEGYSVDSRIAEPLTKMLKAAEADGMRIIICSAYRDTALSVALPGTSEHGLGLALDLISNQYTELDEKQAETKEAKWLEENCYKYGFILRYPPEKTAETGIIYEPWHYRYVGEDDAKKIMESGMTLEEYLEESY